VNDTSMFVALLLIVSATGSAPPQQTAAARIVVASRAHRGRALSRHDQRCSPARTLEAQIACSHVLRDGAPIAMAKDLAAAVAHSGTRPTK
jgi:hypothetical protein